MPAGPRKPVERHNGRVYWPTRDVALGFCGLFPRAGPDFRYTNFSGGWGVYRACTKEEEEGERKTET